MRSDNLKIVISGGPGSGKTTIIEMLKKKGYVCYEEFSRMIIQEGKQKGLENYFFSEPEAFSEVLFQGRKKHFEEAHQKVKIKNNPFIFFDRGIHDTYAYLNAVNQGNSFWKERVMAYRYDVVFLLPPWENIYVQDEERMESFKEAALFYSYIESVYKESKTKIIEVPKASPEERTTFIEKHLSAYG